MEAGTNRGHMGVNSLQFRIFAGFTLLAAVLLAILNTYPIGFTRNQMIIAKEKEMRSDFGAFSAALESTSKLDYDTAGSVISILDIGRGQRVLVVDSRGKVVYDNLKTSNTIDKTVLFPDIIEALDGSDVFRCSYDNEAFNFRIACSIMKDSRVVGAVYAYEYDTESAGLLAETQNDIFRISLSVTILTAFFIFTFVTTLRRKFGKVLEGVYQIGRGNYDYRIDLRSSDELGLISEEFDRMSSQLALNESTRKQFVSDASHELRTPLASIKLLCDSIMGARDIKVDDVREFLGDISEEIDRLTRITEGLLYISRMENGRKMDGVCDLTHTVVRATEMLRGNSAAAQVDISYELPDDTYVFGNPDMIYQVVFNLIENAIKYNKKGGSVVIVVRPGEERMILSVCDTGIGIHEEELERIFDRFYRVDKMRSRETRGTGLGLSIVGQCMEAIGGHIEVDSTYGQGTCFTAYFLYAPEPEEVDE